MHGIFLGRFQPFHRGHLTVIEDMLRTCSLITVVIGSANEQGTEKNPWSATQRYQLLTEIIPPHYPIRFCHLNDCPGDDHTRRHSLLQTVGPFDIIYSGNQRVLDIATDNSKRTHHIHYSLNINATMVRYLLDQAYDVSSFLPYDASLLPMLPAHR